MPVTCRRCGRPVELAEGRGRPKAYCSVGCRRAAEYEARRLQRALEAVEEQIRECRLGFYGRSERNVPRFDLERQRLEERLREVLDDEVQA